MTLPDGKWYWAYLDTDGVIRVKKYVSDWDILKVEQLPFCKGIFEVFKADSKQHAKMIIAKWLDEQKEKESNNNSKRIVTPEDFKQ